ncbi:MAG TPA: hypothetical protein DD456_02270 [Stenotrophomonas sp.]|nr:hypothetical protein [Stenotrophomonas sp.]
MHTISPLAERMRVAFVTLVISMAAASSSQAATTSFPQYPLLTGGNSIPPNILMILDDSGSMTYLRMPNDSSSNLADSVSDRSYVTNTLYYNPSATYRPWRTANTNVNDRLAAANFKAAYKSTTSLSDPVDLRTSTSEFCKGSGRNQVCESISDSYFYVPKIANPGTTASNYDKYRIGSSTSSGNVGGGAVQRLEGEVTLAKGTASIKKNEWSPCYAVSPGGSNGIVFTTSGGSGDGDLYVYSSNNCTGAAAYKSDNGNNSESVSYSNPPGTVSFRVYAYSAVSNITYSAIADAYWVNATPPRQGVDADGRALTPRSQADELQNFANWYQYHRTRNKMAKAGASEAFGRLGKNYRVGFDTIWNRGGGSARVGGASPSFPIPVATSDGLFEGSNRSTFYTRLQDADASGNTPLHGALQRAGRYFSSDAAYQDSSGQMLTCRQNYAILTTDGYWNQADSNGGYTSKVGDYDTQANGAEYYDKQACSKGSCEGYADTLADVAYYYWKNDLRSGMANNVRPSANDPATWQHMVTFGVSIGQQGTLDPNLPAPKPWNVDPIKNSGAERIDDLWHASLNGHGSFVVASDTDKFASALTAALAAIDSRSASGSNIASSSTKTETTTLTFVAGFTSGSWIGDLIASPFNAALTGVSSTPKWSMSGTFKPGGINVQAAAPFASRTVLTSFGGTAKLFDSTTLAGATVFQRNGTTNDVGVADNINYLRGDQSLEAGQVDGTLRKRAYPLGDIVDSSPAYVEDTGTVYVGANDGMLHGIRVEDGRVLFSYVPKGLDFAELAKLSSREYEHHYFVDGQIDVVSRANQGNGRNILVGALGRGGRGVFALDVTDPAAMGVTNVLWDKTTQDTTSDKNMGYVLGAVRIRKGNGGKTYALVPNGIDSPNGTATLYAYELDANGGIVATRELVADPGSGNGLMSLGLADLNGDGLLDVVYGGDLLGNVWRWDFSGSTPSAAVKLFQAVDASNKPQPITGGLSVGRSSTGTIFVGFGTGRFISSTDVPGAGVTSQTQSLYGIIDKAATITDGRSKLQKRTIPYSGSTAKGADARGFETYSILPSDKLGWYVDLPPPERVISAPTIYGSGMYVASVIPATGSDCSGASGSGYINALNLFTGTAPKSGSYFTDTTALTDGKGEKGVIGSVGISGGMATEVNVTSGLATVGTGGGLDTDSTGINPPTGAQPSRVSWREIVQ